MERLGAFSEIAVDLEHHSHRSFQAPRTPFVIIAAQLLCSPCLPSCLQLNFVAWVGLIVRFGWICCGLAYQVNRWLFVQGFVCLLQISTRREDFLIDTLALRSHIGVETQRPLSNRIMCMAGLNAAGPFLSTSTQKAAFVHLVCIARLRTNAMVRCCKAQVGLMLAAGRELGGLFADPSIVKVLHGSDSDIL